MLLPLRPSMPGVFSDLRGMSRRKSTAAPLHRTHGTFGMPDRLSKHDYVVLHHVRLSGANSSYFRFKIKQAASPFCTLSGVREDLNHYVNVRGIEQLSRPF